MTTDLDTLRAENEFLREQLDDLGGRFKDSPHLAAKYWQHWARTRGELKTALAERDRARDLAARLEAELADIERVYDIRRGVE